MPKQYKLLDVTGDGSCFFRAVYYGFEANGWLEKFTAAFMRSPTDYIDEDELSQPSQPSQPIRQAAKTPSMSPQKCTVCLPFHLWHPTCPLHHWKLQSL